MLYDAGEIDNKQFLALEFIEGVDLDKMIQQRGPFPIVLACDCIRQAAQGLQHAHGRRGSPRHQTVQPGL